MFCALLSFEKIFRVRYLTYIAACIFLFSCVNTQKKSTPILGSITVSPDTSMPVKEEIYNSKTALKLDSLFKIWCKTNRFNGNVLIAQHGKIIYKKCFGYANFETKEPLQYNSAFQLASVSKQFTATAIMILKEKGKLNYIDFVCSFFPDFPYKDITIQMLLTHRSGLANYMYFCEKYCSDHDSPISNQDVVKLMIDNKPETYKKPDRRFYYNNTNYCLLAAIVEKISGMHFGEFVKQEIFIPLDMKNTWIKSSPADTLNPHVTLGYESIWKKGETNYLDGVVGDKNVYSTIEDLYKWDQALYTEKILKQSTLSEAFEPHSKELRRGIKNYGYGWRLLNYPDGTKIIYHNGWWHGYNTSFYRRLNDHTTIIILSNRKNKGIFQTQSIFNILDGPGLDIGEEEEDT